MKKKIIFFAMLFAGLSLMAKPVEPKKAVQVAKNFVAQYVKGADQYSAEVVYTHLMPKSKLAAMYVVNVGNMFVLVSADDVAHPVLGYSLSRPWPTSERGNEKGEMRDGNIVLPSQVSGYLDDLAAQIESAVPTLREGCPQGGECDNDIAAEWHQLLTHNSQLLTTNPPDSVGWGPARYFQFPGSQGTVGFISPLSRHFCSQCNRLRLTADGKLRPCLFSDREIDVRAALRNGGEETVYECFLEALNLKPDDHHDKVGTERNMSQIGG